MERASTTVLGTERESVPSQTRRDGKSKHILIAVEGGSHTMSVASKPQKRGEGKKG